MRSSESGKNAFRVQRVTNDQQIKPVLTLEQETRGLYWFPRDFDNIERGTEIYLLYSNDMPIAAICVKHQEDELAILHYAIKSNASIANIVELIKKHIMYENEKIIWFYVHPIDQTMVDELQLLQFVWKEQEKLPKWAKQQPKKIRETEAGYWLRWPGWA